MYYTTASILCTIITQAAVCKYTSFIAMIYIVELSLSCVVKESKKIKS